jgi:hypothetical protein
MRRGNLSLKKKPAMGDVSDQAFNCFLDYALFILYKRRAELNRAIRSLQHLTCPRASKTRAQ